MSASKITKKHKKTITLEMKLDILRRFDKGEKAVEISKVLCLAPTTLRSIRDRDGNKIREAAKSITSLDTKTVTRTRSALMTKMESLLSIWIENLVGQKMPLSKIAIQTKAKSLFEDIKIKLNRNESSSSSGTEKDENFEASNGWFERFKVRGNLHNIAFTGEAASADSVAATLYPTELKSIINEGSYSPKQVFNVDETGLFWKRLPSRTFLSKNEKSASGFKASKDRLTLLLGGNAYGDFKFKPVLIYKSENPRALKGHSKKRLPVHWRANKKAWMTAALFKDWVQTCAIPEIKAYCKKENLDFKALVLLDNAPSHPLYIQDLSENVKFVFLPPNTTSLIQPMDQGVISTFKTYYLRRSLKLLLNKTDGANKPTIQEIWKKFDVMKAIEIISDSWDEVKPSCMNGVWRKVWTECVHKKREDCATEEGNHTSAVRLDIVNLARESNFEGMEEEDINELLASHNDEINNEDLMDLDLEYAYKENSVPESPKPPDLSSKQLSKAMSLIDDAVEIFIENDPDFDRSSKVARAIDSGINCYKELYRELKQNAVQSTLDKYFIKEKRQEPASTDSLALRIYLNQNE